MGCVPVLAPRTGHREPTGRWASILIPGGWGPRSHPCASRPVRFLNVVTQKLPQAFWQVPYFGWGTVRCQPARGNGKCDVLLSLYHDVLKWNPDTSLRAPLFTSRHAGPSIGVLRESLRARTLAAPGCATGQEYIVEVNRTDTTLSIFFLLLQPWSMPASYSPGQAIAPPW